MIAVSILVAATLVAPAPPSPSIERAQLFRLLVQSGEAAKARRLAVAEPRAWFETREGAGRGLDLTGQEPWKAWDEHFRSLSEELGWAVRGDTVVLTLRETNDYYVLLEREPVTLEVVYYFDAQGKVEGQLVRSAGLGMAGRTDEFLAWAKWTAPEELEYLRPGGEIDPSGDRAVRTRMLLLRWRKASWLPEIAGMPVPDPC